MQRFMMLAASFIAATVFLFTPSVFAQDLYDCADFQFQEDAQAILDQDPSDPYGLDGPPGPAFAGVQGVACEELPRRGTAPQPAPQQPAPQQPGTAPQTMPVTGVASSLLWLFGTAVALTGSGLAVRRRLLRE